MTNNQPKISEFEIKLRETKRDVEGLYVGSLYQDIILYDEFKIDPVQITSPHWRVYYMALQKIIETQHPKVIDEFMMDNYMSDKPDKLQNLYKKAGGWETIEEIKSIANRSNVQSYYSDILRMQAMLRMYKVGILNEGNYDKFKSLPYEELAEKVEQLTNSIFSDIDLSEDKVYDIKDGLQDMIDRADKGEQRGLPLVSPCLNGTVNGMLPGSLTMISAASGVGKTTFTINQVLPSHIKEGEPLLIMANEESLNKWQQEIITWVANNIFKHDFVKSRFYQGNFTEDEKKVLQEAKEWLEERVEDGLITFVNFTSFSMAKVIKAIRRATIQNDIRYFVLDTMKLDNDAASGEVGENSWLQMQQNMVKLFNVIKKENKNCHVWITYQLSKSQRGKFLDQSSLGISKNVADVVGTLILLRNALESEKGPKGLAIKKPDGRKIFLDEDKDYFVGFIDKNRKGEKCQIVWNIDYKFNKMRDVGYTKIAQDF